MLAAQIPSYQMTPQMFGLLLSVHVTTAPVVIVAMTSDTSIPTVELAFMC